MCNYVTNVKDFIIILLLLLIKLKQNLTLPVPILDEEKNST